MTDKKINFVWARAIQAWVGRLPLKHVRITHRRRKK